MNRSVKDNGKYRLERWSLIFMLLFFVIFDFFQPSSPLGWGPLSLLSYTSPRFNHSPFYLKTILTLHIGEYRKTDFSMGWKSPPEFYNNFNNIMSSAWWWLLWHTQHWYPHYITCTGGSFSFQGCCGLCVLYGHMPGYNWYYCYMHTVMRRRAEKSTEKRKPLIESCLKCTPFHLTFNAQCFKEQVS